MTAVNATEARKDLFGLIRRAIRRHEAVPIRHREGSVVLLSEEDYEGLLETLDLMATPGFRRGLDEAEADVALGRTVSAKELLK